MIPYERFSDASSSVHILQGAAFIFLGVCQTVKMQNPSTVLKKICPAVFLAAGALAFTAVFYYLGNFSREELLSSLRIKSGLYLLPAFSLALAALGISMFMELIYERKIFWKALCFFLLFFLVFLNAIFPYKVSTGARLESLAMHMTIAAPAAIGLLLKMINNVVKKKLLGAASAVFLLMTGFLLVMYRESYDSFKDSPTIITEQSVSPYSGWLELPNPSPGRLVRKDSAGKVR